MKTLNILVDGNYESVTIAYNVSSYENNEMIIIDEGLGHFPNMDNIKLCIYLLNIVNKYDNLPILLENNYNAIRS